MTILEILNQVLAQSSFLKKDSFESDSDPDDQQMMAIANRVAYEIFNFYDWGVLRNVTTLKLVEGQTTYDVPDDYQSYVPDSAWETDGSRKVDIPVDDAEWYQYKFSSLTSGGTIRARFYGRTIEVIEPFNGGSFTYEYVSRFPIKSGTTSSDPLMPWGEWAVGALPPEPDSPWWDKHQWNTVDWASITSPNPPDSPTGSLWDTDYWGLPVASKEFFTKDNDVWLLDDQLLVLGIQAHWKQAKQMPNYMENMANYMVKMAEAIGRSNAGQTIGGAPSLIRRDPYTKLWVR